MASKNKFGIREGTQTIVLVSPNEEELADETDNIILINHSIDKWKFARKNINNLRQVGDSDNCALCIVYDSSKTNNVGWCEGCPINEYTDEPFCNGTPYSQAATSFSAWFSARKGDSLLSSSLLAISRLRVLKRMGKEIKFLKMILELEKEKVE